MTVLRVRVALRPGLDIVLGLCGGSYGFDPSHHRDSPAPRCRPGVASQPQLGIRPHGRARCDPADPIDSDAARSVAVQVLRRPLIRAARFLARRFAMAREDVVAGKIKQARGKANDIAGAVTGNTTRQIKGKLQKAAGRIQEELGKEPKRSRVR